MQQPLIREAPDIELKELVYGHAGGILDDLVTFNTCWSNNFTAHKKLGDSKKGFQSHSKIFKQWRKLVATSNTKNTLLKLRVITCLSGRSNKFDSGSDVVNVLLNMCGYVVSEFQSVNWLERGGLYPTHRKPQ